VFSLDYANGRSGSFAEIKILQCFLRRSLQTVYRSILRSAIFTEPMDFSFLLKPWHSLDIVKSSQGTFVAKHSRMDLHSNECGHFQNRIIKLNKKLYENT